VDTYYLILLEVRGRTVKYGPFVEFKNAVRLVTDHMEHLVSMMHREAADSPVTYTVSIAEVMPRYEGWETISIILEDNYTNGVPN
jgi:hypothetical protein